MELKLNRDLFLKSLAHIQGIVEKKILYQFCPTFYWMRLTEK
jgi:hypothetical protein